MSTTKSKTRKYRFPRRYSRSYCIATPCKSMGFTQRSSCRPYKNCYRTRKMKRGRKQ